MATHKCMVCAKRFNEEEEGIVDAQVGAACDKCCVDVCWDPEGAWLQDQAQQWAEQQEN